MPNRIVNGSSAETRAYGFSGKRPYHFSSKYLIPCAMRIENGRIKKTILSGLKPVINRQKIISSVAIELREAKNPFVVENKPIKDKAKVAILRSGDSNAPSVLLCQERGERRAL